MRGMEDEQGKEDSQGIYLTIFIPLSLRGHLHLAESLDQRSFQGADFVELFPLLGSGNQFSFFLSLSSFLFFFFVFFSFFFFFPFSLFLPLPSCLFFFFFVFLGLNLRHMEVPKVGVESELHLQATATATAMPDLCRVCDLHHSSSGNAGCLTN